MNSTLPRHLFALSLTLGLLTACGSADPPLIGTPVGSLADSGPGSLRAALADAAAGDTLRLTQTGTLTLQTPLSPAKNVTILAEGVTVQAPTTGRALEVPAGVTLTLKGGILRGGTGAVLPASLNRAELSAQFVRSGMDTPKLSAAGLRAQADAQPTVGGVVLNQGTLTLDGVTVAEGKANLGGGIYNAAGATLTLSGSTNVTGNEASLLDSTLDVSQGYGGGIYNRGTLTLAGGSVSRNTALYSGGGIHGAPGGTVTMSAGAVNDNKVTYPVTITNGVTSGAAGGGIYSNGPLTISGGSVSGNSASLFGGGIAVQAYRNAQDELVRPTLTVSGGTFENNAVIEDVGEGSGGAIWCSGIPTISGGTVRGNEAPYGGGLGVFADATITGGLIEDNRARLSGGGIFTYVYVPSNRTAPTLTFGGTATVRGNTAAEYGGGVIAARFNWVITGGTIENNTALKSGGGIDFSGGSVSRIEGGTVSGNRATGTGSGEGGGGGVSVSRDSQLTLAGGSVTGNTAAMSGGGLGVGGQVTMTGGSVTGNTAAVSGGGLVVGGQVTMTGGSVSGNTVTSGEVNEGGGGVRLYAGAKMTASGGSIQDNRARWGAGVSIDGPYQTSPTAEFTLSGATVSGNVVTDSSNNGGGFFNYGKLTLTSGSVTGNTATRSGGGVFNSRSATYAQTGGTVSGNTPDNVFTEP